MHATAYLIIVIKNLNHFDGCDSTWIMRMARCTTDVFDVCDAQRILKMFSKIASYSMHLSV